MLTNASYLIANSILLTICILITSCSVKEKVTEQELNDYLLDEENGLIKSKSKGDIKIDVVYKPAELVWVKELSRTKDIDAMGELRKNYDSLNYFILHFSRNGREIESAFVSDPIHFKQIIEYLSSDLRNNIFLIHGSDTTQALDVAYTRTYGGSEGTSVLAVFHGNLKDNSSTIKVCLDDTMLGVGLTEFEFDVNDIKNTPNLMLN